MSNTIAMMVIMSMIIPRALRRSPVYVPDAGQSSKTNRFRIAKKSKLSKKVIVPSYGARSHAARAAFTSGLPDRATITVKAAIPSKRSVSMLSGLPSNICSNSLISGGSCITMHLHPSFQPCIFLYRKYTAITTMTRMMM
jgi:hypothetical protein